MKSPAVPQLVRGCGPGARWRELPFGRVQEHQLEPPVPAARPPQRCRGRRVPGGSPGPAGLPGSGSRGGAGGPGVCGCSRCRAVRREQRPRGSGWDRRLCLPAVAAAAAIAALWGLRFCVGVSKRCEILSWRRREFPLGYGSLRADGWWFWEVWGASLRRPEDEGLGGRSSRCGRIGSYGRSAEGLCVVTVSPACELQVRSP